MSREQPVMNPYMAEESASQAFPVGNAVRRKSATFVETMSFLLGVIVSLGTILYLGRGITDELGKGRKATKYLELISTCEYIAAILLLLGFGVLSFGKLCLFGYERVMTVDSAEEEELAFQDEKDMTNMVRTRLLHARIDEQLKKRGDSSKPHSLSKGASFRLARDDDSEVDIITDAALELQDLLKDRMDQQKKPIRIGIGRLPRKLQSLLRFCLFTGAECCLLATVSGCVSFFFSFVYKVHHAPLVAHLMFACALSLVGVVVSLGCAMVMYTAVYKY